MDPKAIFKLRAEEKQYTAEQIKEEILSYLAEKTLVKKENIRLDSHFINDLSLDSLERIELIMWCEAKFRIAIDYPEIDNLVNVQDLIRLVQEKHLK